MRALCTNTGEVATALTGDSDDFWALEQGSVSKPRACQALRSHVESQKAVRAFLCGPCGRISFFRHAVGDPKVEKAKKLLPHAGTWHPRSLPDRQA